MEEEGGGVIRGVSERQLREVQHIRGGEEISQGGENEIVSQGRAKNEGRRGHARGAKKTNKG
jgi:hypothetical protein